MKKFKTLKCYHCSSVVANLPETELLKLNGLTFRCECCNHKNQLHEFEFKECLNDNFISIFMNTQVI
ncbi:MAG: hypothetical protein N2484_03150 [Clostridia bacterium]|nr:hypothetical protein [Clostridia bacterium]